MATPSESPLRTFAFGALGGEVWLAGWFPAPGPRGVLLVGGDDGDRVQAREASLHTSPDEHWSLSAAGAALTLAPTSAAAVLAGAEGPVPGFAQGASLSGTLDGAPIELAGSRGERPEGEPPARLDSVRELVAWFDDGEVVALSAARPRKHKGHEQDAIYAAVVDPEHTVEIVEPRLSTTYTAGERVRRVGLELWDADEEAPPLRLVADGRQRGGTVTAGGWVLTADWLIAHRRGRDGAGVYLLARPA